MSGKEEKGSGKQKKVTENDIYNGLAAIYDIVFQMQQDIKTIGMNQVHLQNQINEARRK